MKRTRGLLLLVIAAILVLAFGYYELQHKNGPQHQTNEPNQLRLRLIEPMEGGTRTYVFTENRTLECEGNWQHDSSIDEEIHKTSGCKEARIKLSRTDLESKLRSFSELEWKK